MSVSRFLGTPPPDKAGSSTAGLFHWQAGVAATDSFVELALSLQAQTETDQTSEFYCEHHEDYAVFRPSSGIELVSVKHRGRPSGAWTWSSILKDGGIIHLYERWLSLGSAYRTRLVSNGGLSPSTPNGAKRLQTAADVLSGRHEQPTARELELAEESVSRLARDLVGNLSADSLPEKWRRLDETGNACLELAESARRFLSALSLDCERSHVDDLRYSGPERYVEPVLEILDLPPHLAKAVWGAVHDVFAERMRSEGKGQSSGLDTLISIALNEDRSAAQRRVLSKQRVSCNEVLSIIRRVAADPSGFAISPSRLAPTTLAIKLLKGGCTPTTVRSAERFAESWRDNRRRRTADVPGNSVEFARAERLLLRTASIAAEDASRETTERYGPEMWKLLNERITPQLIHELPLQRDETLAVGGICDLTSRCEVWFSDVFDIDLERAHLNREGIFGGGVR
ncbi:hypothetical protein EV383_0542 [Pseudonocardia sediminis]|uniref:CD-NTase associated protein 4-like DNA endonuclease domain-containing protein n=1 Tax=Pseudonocardia sediminis TaxID=1397368 RepID=A0A4Q7URY9_PSEST|nr:hypothetical protein EV383_0542 [Pseudonocardia sediminis]